MKLLQFIQDALPLAVPDSVPTPRQEISMLKSLPLDELLNRMANGIVTLLINVTIAILVFYVGKFIISKIYNIVRGILLRRRVDSSLASFVLSFVRIVLYFILIVTVIGILGIETSSFLAIFASAGVAIGMALSGTLQNFAGGVLILLLKPYKVGDYIEAQGYAGTVKEIQIFHTLIVTPDNKAIIIPNGSLSTGSVNNWSREDIRRVDWTVGISYGDDIDTARKAILSILKANDKVLADNCIIAGKKEAEAPQQAEEAPAEEEEKKSFWDHFRSHRKRLKRIQAERQKRVEALIPKQDCTPSIVVNNLGDSAVELRVRAWTRTGDYWTVYYGVLEQIYTRFKDSDVIHFPFPQLDVHLTQPTPTPK